MVGFLRSLAREHPALRPRAVGIEGSDLASALAVECALDDGEDSVLWRNDKRHVERLLPLAMQPSLPAVRKLGADLNVATTDKPALNTGEVLIRVRAAGINYKDALTAAGQMPLVGDGLGAECAGEVEAIAGDVTGIAVGDPVIAVTTGTLATHARADARLVLPKPAALTFAEAAAIPIAGATAWHAVHELARVKRGERVLIHSASGGVGWFAMQFARAVGAEVVATAGSDAKRRRLAANGIREVYSSRDTSFSSGRAGRCRNQRPARRTTRRQPRPAAARRTIHRDRPHRHRHATGDRGASGRTSPTTSWRSIRSRRRALPNCCAPPWRRWPPITPCCRRSARWAWPRPLAVSRP